MSIFNNEKKQGGDFRPVFKSPDQVKKENKETPTNYAKHISKINDTLENEFYALDEKPPTKQNQIDKLKCQIKLFYQIERLPKMNKSVVKKLSLIVNNLDRQKNLKKLIEIERGLYEII